MNTVIIVTVFIGLQGVLGYPGGAPSSACVYLLPKHGYPNFEAQISPSPYKLVLSSATYSPGQEMEVAIVSEATPFNGWLLQVRRVDNDMIVGQFIASPEGSRIASCNGQDNSITHSNSYMFPNTTLRAKWIAPQEDVGNLILTGTVLKDYSTFWGPLESNEIPFVPAAPSIDTTDPKPTINTTTTTLAPSTSTPSPTTTTTAVPPTTTTPRRPTEAPATTKPPTNTTLPPTTTPQPTTTSSTTPRPTTTSSTTPRPTTASPTTPRPTTPSSTTPQPTTTSSTTPKHELPSTTTIPSSKIVSETPIQPTRKTPKPLRPEPSTTPIPEETTKSVPPTTGVASASQEKTDTSSTDDNGSSSLTGQNLIMLISLWGLYWCK